MIFHSNKSYIILASTMSYWNPNNFFSLLVLFFRWQQMCLKVQWFLLSWAIFAFIFYWLNAFQLSTAFLVRKLASKSLTVCRNCVDGEGEPAVSFVNRKQSQRSGAQSTVIGFAICQGFNTKTSTRFVTFLWNRADILTGRCKQKWKGPNIWNWNLSIRRFKLAPLQNPRIWLCFVFYLMVSFPCKTIILFSSSLVSFSGMTSASLGAFLPLVTSSRWSSSSSLCHQVRPSHSVKMVTKNSYDRVQFLLPRTLDCLLTSLSRHSWRRGCIVKLIWSHFKYALFNLKPKGCGARSRLASLKIHSQPHHCELKP